MCTCTHLHTFDTGPYTPATNLATKTVNVVKELDTEMLQDDVQQLPVRAQRWLADLDDPVEVRLSVHYSVFS